MRIRSLLAVAVASVPAAWGQTERAVILGTVTDDPGRSFPGPSSPSPTSEPPKNDPSPPTTAGTTMSRPSTSANTRSPSNMPGFAKK